MTLILKVNASRPDTKKIRRAAEIIKRGGVVVFPTETVYGIGANALDSAACKRIFEIKKRALDNPLIVHASDLEMAKAVGNIPSRYLKIMKRIWPGPVTIVVKAGKRVTNIVTANLGTVSIRIPDNKIALKLIEESGVPIAAPSANISKRPSSTKASHARGYFSGKVDAIIESGPSKFGLESTIIDLGSFTLLRPGAFTIEQIEKAFGKKVKVTAQSRGLSTSKLRPLSPGMKYAHYSPETPLFMFNGNIGDLGSITSGLKGRFAFIGTDESCKIIRCNSKRVLNLGKRNEKERIASKLFDALISLDSIKPNFAIVESFDEEGIGLAIMNRLRKACGNRYFKSKEELYNLLKGV